VSTFAEALAELVAVIAEAAALREPREDPRHRHGMPTDATSAAALISELPGRVGALVRLPRTQLETWYRGGGRQAKVKVIHVSEFGADDVGNIVATALDQEGGRVEEADLEGDLVYVAFREDAGEDVEAGVWGLASGQWAVVVTGDSRETRADVTRAVARTVAATGDRKLRLT
jgi:hypothetical protein